MKNKDVVPYLCNNCKNAPKEKCIWYKGDGKYCAAQHEIVKNDLHSKHSNRITNLICRYVSIRQERKLQE